MAIQDLWVCRDGTPTKRYGRGLRYRVRTPGYKTTSHKTRKEAEYVNASRIAAGPPTPEKLELVSELVELWLAGKKGLSPKGYEAAANAATTVINKWGDWQASKLSPMAIQAWLAELEVQVCKRVSGESVVATRPASASLRHKVAQCLKGALGGDVDLSGLKVPKEVRREAVFLDVDQLKRLAGYCAGYEALIMLLGTTGLRIGEALALDKGDVDVERGRLRVHRSKTGAGRDVPVPQTVLSLLDLSGESSDPLFVNSRGRRLQKDPFRQRHWVPARNKLGVQGLRLHDLRHTAASLAIAAGADVKSVQRMLGHASAAMTLDIYAGLFDKQLDEVASRVNDLLS